MMASLRFLIKNQTGKVWPTLAVSRQGCMASFSSDGASDLDHFFMKQNQKQTYDNKFNKAAQSSVPGIDAMPFIQGFRSKEHEFCQFRSRTMDRSGEESDVCKSGNYIDTDTPEDPYNNCYQPMSNVSLYSVMQTNVPEPYSRNPGHMNMPGGGVKFQDKVTAGHLNDTHYMNYPTFGGSRRSFSSSAISQNSARDGGQGIQGPFPWLNGETVESLSERENPAPQGVQGMNCEQFKLWLANCTKYNIIECDQQLNDLREGRKTLAQIFEEQELIIEQVATEYKSKASQEKRT